MKEIKLMIILLLSTSLLFGCATNEEEGAMDDRRDNTIQNVGNRHDNVNQPRMDVADNAAQQVKKIDEVKQANVIVTEENAYVAVMLRNGSKGEVTNQLEEQIADKVRATDPDIDNVYVSSNPDFFERMNDYGESIANGDPIEGLFDEFNETVRRIFPNAR